MNIIEQEIADGRVFRVRDIVTDFSLEVVRPDPNKVDHWLVKRHTTASIGVWPRSGPRRNPNLPQIPTSALVSMPEDTLLKMHAEEAVAKAIRDISTTGSSHENRKRKAFRKTDAKHVSVKTLVSMFLQKRRETASS